MTNEERVRSLRAFSYTEREAQFVCLAALHSGYFLRPHYHCFLRLPPGWVDDIPVRKLLALGHATEESTDPRILRYHRCLRTFCDVIGESDHRHRRRRPPFAIKAKLMDLDFGLSNPGNRYLATGEERMAYFTGELGFQKQVLPTKIYHSRDGKLVTHGHFVDKLPIFIARGDNSHFPLWCPFAMSTREAFQPWDSRHIFTNTPSYFARWVVSESPTSLPRREALIRRRRSWIHFFARPMVCVSIQDSCRLIDYPELENLYRAGPFDCLDVTKLERLRILRKQFPADLYADLFQAWKEAGEASVNHILNARQAQPLAFQCAFRSYPPRYDYDVVGYPDRSKIRPGRSK